MLGLKFHFEISGIDLSGVEMTRVACINILSQWYIHKGLWQSLADSVLDKYTHMPVFHGDMFQSASINKKRLVKFQASPFQKFAFERS